jgi:hypothetical protein
MPVALLRCHVAMLRRLEAEAAIAQLNAIDAGFGSMDQDHAKAYVAQLNEAAGGTPAPKPTPTSPREAMRQLASAGFPVDKGSE